LTWRGGTFTTRRYWHPDHSEAAECDAAEVLPRLIDALDEAVRIRLVSDVPLGLLLSGGIDSGLVLAMMSRHTSEAIKTFSIGFEEKEYDESEPARIVANAFGADHTERIVGEDELYAGLPRAVWNAEEPNQDYSFLPTFVVCQLARSKVTVALSGDGGDENFGGYYIYIRDDQYDPRALSLAKAPRILRAALGAAGTVLGAAGPSRAMGDRLSRLAQRASETPESRYLRKRSMFPDFEVAALFSPEMRARVGGHDPSRFLLDLLAETPRGEGVNQLLHTDLLSYLTYDVLVKVDRCAMATSLEVRCPLLDHKVIEYAARICSDLKVRDEVTKWILREAARKTLPPPIPDLPKKGFGIPLAEWMRGRMAPLIDNVVLSERAMARGYFRPDLIRTLRDQHLAGVHDQSVKLYMLLSLELWHRTYIDGPPACGDERLYDA
jgi:asparagine synthase (glutamine-hydrolysing)